MTDQEFFLGIMVLKDDKWTPHQKFEDGAFGSALIAAEEVDKNPGFDGVKILRLPKDLKSSTPPKEMWISPRFEAQKKAREAKMVLDGAKKSQKDLAAARRHIKK